MDEKRVQSVLSSGLCEGAACQKAGTRRPVAAHEWEGLHPAGGIKVKRHPDRHDLLILLDVAFQITGVGAVPKLLLKDEPHSIGPGCVVGWHVVSPYCERLAIARRG